MDSENKKEEVKRRPGRLKLVWRFLKGSRFMFLMCMVSAAVSALADMINPQIIRVAVDNVIGKGSTESLGGPMLRVIALFGGMAIALILGGGAYFLRGLPEGVYLLICIAVLAIPTLLLLRWINRKGADIFAHL